MQVLGKCENGMWELAFSLLYISRTKSDEKQSDMLDLNVVICKLSFIFRLTIVVQIITFLPDNYRWLSQVTEYYKQKATEP